MAASKNAFTPDWTYLNGIASAYAASSPLMPQVVQATPAGSYNALGLQKSLSEIMKEAEGKLDANSGVLVVAVDTLAVPAGQTVVKAFALSIMARHIAVEGGGAAEILQHASSASSGAVQIMVSQITGTVSLGLSGSDKRAPLELAGNMQRPQVLTVTADAPGKAVAVAGDAALADFLHSPWNVLALEIAQAAAGVMIYQNERGALALAADMLNWVVRGCYTLIKNRASFENVDYQSVSSIQGTAVAQLSFTQASASGATFVPVLSQSTYETQVNSLVGIARIYDEKIGAFQAQKNLDNLLGQFASTLNGISQSAETPLVNTLKRLNNEQAQLSNQLQNATIKLARVSEQIEPLQKALVKAIEKKFQEELLKSALETLMTFVTLYIGVGIAILGDPELVTTQISKFTEKQVAAAIKLAVELSEKAIKSGVSVAGIVESGSTSLGGAPTKDDAEKATSGAQAMMGSVASFSQASVLLWTVVNRAFVGGGRRIDMNPDLLAELEKMPDLSGFSVGGLDPVAYWNSTVVKTRAYVEPYKDMGEAQAYLTAVESASVLGQSVGDLEMKLLAIFNQGMDAFDRLRAVYAAEAHWKALQTSLEDKSAKIDAAIGLLQRGYNSVKRDIMLSVENYRAAFRYQWLRESDVEVNASMDYLQLASEAQKSVSDLANVLAGTATGVLRPRQTFTDVTYSVEAGEDGLFQEVDGKPQAEWAIPADSSTLSGQLNGNSAIFLKRTRFELVGADQTAEVQLTVNINGSFENRRASQDYRFVSLPVSMINNYRPGNADNPITSWEFADAAAYLTPTPYTRWTLTVNAGETEGVTAIKMTSAGLFLQN